MSELVLFDSRSVPAKGQASAKHPLAMLPGEFELIQNFRRSAGPLVSRNGAASLISKTGLSGTFAGAHYSEHGQFIAMIVSGKARIYKRGGGSWSEITDVTTRLPGTSRVTFSVIREPGGSLYIVAQNGEASVYPRIMAVSGSSMSIHAQLSRPDPSACRSKIYYLTNLVIAEPDGTRMPNGLVIGDVTVTGAVTKTLVSDTGQGQHLKLLFPTTLATGDLGHIFSTTRQISDFTSCTKLHILYKADFVDLWSSIKIEIGKTGPAWTTVWDPTSTTYGYTTKDPRITAGTNSLYLAEFDIPTIAAGITYGIRFTWVGTAPPADVALHIYGVMGHAGQVAGGAEFGVTNFDATTMSESASAVCQTDLTFARDYGCTKVSNLTIPVAALLSYSYHVTGVGNPARVYVREVGDSDFHLITNLDNALYGTGYQRITSITQGVRRMPRGSTRTIPTASVMQVCGGRLMVGNVRSVYSDADAKDVWFSELNDPFRFEPAVVFDSGVPDYIGAGSQQYIGETIKAIKPIAGPTNGAEGCLVLTNRGFYEGDGSDSLQLSRPRRGGEFGTLSGLSLAVYNKMVFFLDSDRQVRSYGRNFQSLSALSIEDITRAIPDSYIADASGIVWNDKYYLALTPYGSTSNVNVLVYDLRFGGWTLDVLGDGTALNCQWWQVYENAGSRKLVGFQSDGTSFEYEKVGQNDDLGTAYTCKLKTYAITGAMRKPTKVSNVGVLCDKASGKTLTVNLNKSSASDTPVSGSIDLAAASPRVSGAVTEAKIWRESDSSNLTHGCEDVAVGIELSVQPGAAWNLYRLFADVEVIDGGIDRS